MRYSQLLSHTISIDNTRAKTTTSLEESETKFYDFGLHKTVDRTKKHEPGKKNMINWTSPKLKTSVFKRLMRIKRIATYWVNMLENRISDHPPKNEYRIYKNFKRKKAIKMAIQCAKVCKNCL